MKKYCLKDEAKSTAKEFFTAIGIVTGAILFFSGAVILNTKVGSFECTLGYFGIISWTILLSYLVITFKRWLQDSIIEC